MSRVALAGLVVLLVATEVRAAPPAVTRVDVTHEGSPLLVAVHGASLGAVTAATVLTPDPTWTIPLTIGTRTDTTLSASGVLPQALRGASLSLATGGDVLAPVPLRDDVVVQAADSERVATRLRNLYDPDPLARPKDFAFFANTVYVPPPAGVGWHRIFHVYYIRHLDTGVGADDNETAFGHAWWRDDGVNDTWKFDTAAFTRAGVGWDALHVWAPSIVFQGGRYVMFYTGVDAAHAQRIGYATIAMIDTTDTSAGAWQRQGAPVFGVENAGWTAKRAPQECRDPFVMPNPDGPGLLMVYTALDSATTAMAAGLAKCISGLDDWSDAGHYVATDRAHSQTRRLESPHVFADSASITKAETQGIPLGQVPGVTWRLMFTDGDATNPDSLTRFLTNGGSSVADTSLAAWSQPGLTSLFDYTRSGPFTVNVKHFQSTERLRDGRTDFLAGFQGYITPDDTLLGLAFRRLYWPHDPEFVLSDSAGVLTVAAVPPPRGGALRLVVTELVPGEGRVRFRIEAPAPLAARVDVYDVTGREVRRLFDSTAAAGGTDVSWDGRGAGGKPVRSGVYFVRLSAAGTNRAVRVPFIR